MATEILQIAGNQAMGLYDDGHTEYLKLYVEADGTVKALTEDQAKALEQKEEK